jgi:hypothetical protein
MEEHGEENMHSPLLLLPKEILSHVLAFTRPLDVLVLRLVCRRLSAATLSHPSRQRALGPVECGWSFAASTLSTRWPCCCAGWLLQRRGRILAVPCS